MPDSQITAAIIGAVATILAACIGLISIQSWKSRRNGHKKIAQFFREFQQFVHASIRDHWAATLFQQNYSGIPTIAAAMNNINTDLILLETVWLTSAGTQDANQRWKSIRGGFKGIMVNTVKLLNAAQAERQNLLNQVGAGKGTQKLQQQLQQLGILEANIPVWMQAANRFECVLTLPGDLD